ncbi:hypothetical protein LTR91_008489 [Friedmanniomyces endolithicus]|uniref:PLC-like phosphodiesterase n=1 Tax=Friedmanniomyces endolithicus TaxID=329885 RepID=A0AAN6KPH5_9PEZI|nr:hypothetical protein LTR94_009490 [Friedmanniomyces endolithicus]KAK0798464.1 hypothetical protein LTR59_006469 [Friedmanniomyces endolithicus]KAK0811286.1 hypothetical protein LTR38_003614 [Friedmanniomyces endolithicus]KAK0845152.1 hypothetical protein LTR03_007650 [Friedmanniomyces endolithicus]KAK0872038.1 hypothetical protein LTS02_001532 [Friedmanniomyces endolithicus]
MLARSLQMLLLLPAALRLAFAQTSNSSTACNNSPDLCQRAYNNITHLGAHDSPFVRDASTGYSLSGNQYYNTTVQLAAGVRLLSAQVQMNSTSGQLSVCHTSCSLLNAGTLRSWLQEVNTWVEANPNEVVTILLVNGASASATALAAEYEAAGISNIAYTPTRSSAIEQWPTLQQLINNGTRLLNFVATLTDNTGAPYLMNEFDYIFENSYQNTAPTDFSCTANRPDNVANNTSGALGAGMMPLMNHFLYANETLFEMPNTTYLATTNAPSGGVGNLGDAAAQCTSEYGRVPTFVLVDFFNVGPAISAVDRLNGVTAPVGRTGVSTAVASASSTSGAGIMSAGWGKGVVVMLCLTIWAIGGEI